MAVEMPIGMSAEIFLISTCFLERKWCSAVAGVMNDPKKKEQPADAIPVIEEAVVVDKHSVVTGRVRVRTITEFVDDVAHATLEKQKIEIQRVPIDQVVDTPPSVRTEGDITIIPVLEEVLVVEKRLLLKEELHIRPHTESEVIEKPITRRKQRVIVDRIPELKQK